MDLSEIPFDVPVIIQSVYKLKSLQNPVGTNKARCLSFNRDIYEQLFLRRVRKEKIAIQSAHNGRYLQVYTNGDCIFDSKEPGDYELFTIETDLNCALYFVSCRTGNVLQCNSRYHVRCEKKTRLGWEAWKIVEPCTNTITAHVQPEKSYGNDLNGEDRRKFVLKLAMSGKTPTEIKEILTQLFDVLVTVVWTRHREKFELFARINNLSDCQQYCPMGFSQFSDRAHNS
ncbi:putative actin-crosslinking [Plasmopara halstedii]